MAEVNHQSGWFYSENRRKVGPVPWTELRAAAMAGRIKPEDMVLRDGSVKWVAAGSLPDLFASRAKACAQTDMPNAAATLPDQVVTFDLESSGQPPKPPSRRPPPSRPREIPSWLLQFFYYSMGLAVGAVAIVIWYLIWGQ